MTKLILAFIAALLLVPATADASKGQFLHKSEAKLEQIHKVYGKADATKAFYVALGDCVRQSASSVHCSASTWRNDKWDVQLRCNYIVKVTKAHRKGRNVRSKLNGFCGAANPLITEPQPAPAVPEPGEPPYPTPDQGGYYEPN